MIKACSSKSKRHKFQKHQKRHKLQRQFDNQLQLMVPRTRRLRTGAAFSVNGSKLWNALLLNLRNVFIAEQF